MKLTSSRMRPPIHAVWLITLLFLGLSVVTAWAKADPEPLRWTIPTFTPTPTPNTGDLCVMVYHDRNQDGVRQESEEGLLISAEISVLSVSSGVILSETTSSDVAPLCFNALPPDLYVVREKNPPGYRSTTDDAWGAVISANVAISVPFGDVWDASTRLTLPLVLNSYQGDR